MMGFAVEAVHHGADGVAKVKNENYEAVILDVMLPGADGSEVLKQIRQISAVPVLMLTALGDESDRIVGLEIGADDYLPKTFSTRELLARLRAVTRRSRLNNLSASTQEEVTIGELKIYPAARRIELADQTLILTSLEFDLLLTLARAAGRVLDRDRLLDEIAGRSYEVFDRSIDVHISSLRRKLGDDPKNPRYIKTIRSVGYMLALNAES